MTMREQNRQRQIMQKVRCLFRIQHDEKNNHNLLGDFNVTCTEL